MQPSEASALRNAPLVDVPKEPLLRWFARNVLRLTVYLAVASFATALFSLLRTEGSDPLGIPGLAGIYFLYGGYFGVPGTLVWLLVVVLLPPEWSPLRRRAVALAMSPIIQVIWLVWLYSWGYFLAAAVFGLILPAGSAFVVRLRERRPSSPFPPEE
ncbi:MAG: hypothetical protein ACRDG8_13520 [Actinomycetota bacterium]